jgi:hypothetical protein
MRQPQVAPISLLKPRRRTQGWQPAIDLNSKTAFEKSGADISFAHAGLQCENRQNIAPPLRARCWFPKSP